MKKLSENKLDIGGGEKTRRKTSVPGMASGDWFLHSLWQISVDVEPDIRAGEHDGIIADAGLHRALHHHAPHRRDRPVRSKHVPARGKMETKAETEKNNDV